MKIKTCCICRNEEFKRQPIGDIVMRKICDNKDRGCNVDPYYFDDEHAQECLYKPLKCLFCKCRLDDNIDNIVLHLQNDCVNTFERCEVKKDN